MIELPLIFVAGFLGSSHCVGMCGPFALLLGGATSSWQSNLSRQLLYSAGRVFTYSILGATAGFCGLHLANQTAFISVPAVMSILAGCFLVYQGLLTAGYWPSTTRGQQTTCLAGGMLADALRSPHRISIFVAGLFTGFLPCGLVYGFLGIAASSRDILQGALTMLVFGVGTIPVMMLTGMGAGLLAVSTRGKILKLAACCVVLAGMVSIVRGAGFLTAQGDDPAAACPMCADE